MASLPPAIFFVNGDINYPPTKTFIGTGTTTDNLTKLKTQLFIDDIMTKAEFDARVSVDPNYPLVIRLQGYRILVILPTFQDGYNRQYADVTMFIHRGLVDVETNFFGPPCKDYDLDRINMYALLRAARSSNVAQLPFFLGAFPSCEACDYPFFCDRCHTFSGMKVCTTCLGPCGCGCGTVLVDNQGVRVGIIYAPNCSNEYHNRNFINRS